MQPFSFLKWKTVSPLRRGGSMDGRPHHGLGEIVIDKARAWDSSTARFFFLKTLGTFCRNMIFFYVWATERTVDAVVHWRTVHVHWHVHWTRMLWMPLRIRDAAALVDWPGKDPEKKTKKPKRRYHPRKNAKKCPPLGILTPSPGSSELLPWFRPTFFFSVTRKLTFKQRRVHNPVDMICIHLYMNSSVRSDARSFGRQGLAI